MIQNPFSAVGRGYCRMSYHPPQQGWLYIVSGERRYLAARQVGLNVLPEIYVEGNHAEIALVENLQRQDLTAVEEAGS